jgi:TolB protein
LNSSKLIVISVIALCAAGASFGQAVRIDLQGSVDPRVAIAIPDFPAAPGLEATAREMNEVLRYDLYFTGLFNIIGRENFPQAFTGMTADATQINFDAWRAGKIAYIVHAYVSLQGDTLVADCRMFDVNSGSQVVGQRLTASRSVPRLIMHRFSEEIVRMVDGTPGIASSQIVFSGKTSNGNKEIFVADYDGQNVQQLTQHNSISIKPKISPDGKKIAYVSYKERYPFLYVLDRATGRSTSLSRSVGLNAAPAWAPDGQRLALVLSKDGNTEIYLKNADGSGERRLTNDRGGDTSPTWDPSGQQIAFVSDRGGNPQIYLMSASGGNPRRISYQGGKAYDPVWSPNGKMIAYVAELSGQGLQIYVMNADGSGARQLSTSGNNESPSWSVDSRNVIFSSTRSGQNLYAVNVAPPSIEYRIPIGNMRCEGPTWGPRR